MTHNITLPQKLERFIDEQVKNGRFASPSEAVRAGLKLLEQEQIRKSFTFSSRRQLEQKLIEGLDSGPATPMTKDDWQSLKARVFESNKEPA